MDQRARRDFNIAGSASWRKVIHADLVISNSNPRQNWRTDFTPSLNITRPLFSPEHTFQSLKISLSFAIFF